MTVKLKIFLVRHGCNRLLNQNRKYHGIPFYDFYEKTTGQLMLKDSLSLLKKKHPNLDILSHDRLQCTLQLLDKFNITALEACKQPHVFCMNPITLDNYGEILKECGFIKIAPIHIIRYRTHIQSKTIAQLKKEGLLNIDLNLEIELLNSFGEWSDNKSILLNFTEEKTSIVTVRMSVLERYLIWRLGITSDDFKNYCKNYLPLKHKPMSDIQQALHIAQNDIKLPVNVIRRNGFVMSSDPINTKLIIENVDTLAGMDICEAIRIEPAILKNNYNSLIKIKGLLEENRISNEAQRKCLKVFCMCPKTVEIRLNELRSLKEYQVLSSNPRVLSMVVHKRKMMTRLNKIEQAKKQCFSLNHLVSSSKVFNNYINNFGDKVCGRDIAILISSSLDVRKDGALNSESEIAKEILKQLRRHKYWLHAALHVVDENLRYLKNRFSDEKIFNNCQLLMYPVSEVVHYTEYLINVFRSELQLDGAYNILKHDHITDDQILSLVLYEIEKKYHFSGDGIWSRQDGIKMELQSL